MEPCEAMSGKLYGVGLGPGDPELITLKTHRLIGEAEVIAYPAPTGGESFARAIAAPFIPQSAREIRIDIPMDEKRFPAQAAYDAAAKDIAEVLTSGTDVVVFCEGDPFFYGSFMYLFARLSDDFETEIVPGVTSMTACAAASAQPLSARNEVLTVLPATLPEAELEARIAHADALAIMKVGRHLAKLRGVLARQNLTARAQYIERATLPSQKVMPLADAPDTAPYFSMILVTKGGDPWLT
jgi:precorrin-2/cobalt-factor-2 C20-methyltransferase